MNTKLNAKSFAAGIMIVILLLVPSGVSLAQSPQHPETATPFEGEPPSGGGSASSPEISILSIPLIGDTYQTGADRLTALQNNDGGWDWPLDDGNPASVSPKNTVGPIGKGLAEAYLHTSDPDHLAALMAAGTLLLSKTNNFSPSDGYLAATLDDIFGGAVYTTHVMTNFYGPLAAGAYNRNGAGTLYDTAGYVNLIRTNRSGDQANMAAWDLGMGLVGAASAGADTTAWVTGVKAEINELDGANYYDVIGLAGAIYGLAYVSEDFDPTAGTHAAASNLADLGAILASYQISSGGFAWNSAYVIPNDGNEAVQETAYAILALDKLDRTTYLSDIQSAADYLGGNQLGTGGWENYVGYGENNEVTGEALWGVSAAYPLMEGWVCESGDCGHPDASFNSIQEAIAAVQSNGTIHVLAGTYNLASTVILNKALTISGPSVGGGVAKLVANAGILTVFDIQSSNVTIQNLEITAASAGTFNSPPDNELNTSLIKITTGIGMAGIVISGNTLYVPAQSGAMSTWNARAVTAGGSTVAGLSIIGNTIYNTRNGVVIHYNNTVTISDNTIYNTKGGIMNYTGSQADADNRTMSNNSWDTAHNEWDIVWNSGGGPYAQDYNKDVLLLSGANNDAYVLSLMVMPPGTTTTMTGNRSHVWVNSATGTTTLKGANGNMNLPYAKMQDGINAVVPGGTVYVAAGTYPEQVTITKQLTLTGEDGAVLDGTGLAPTWTTGVKIKSGNVTFDNIDVTNFTQDGIIVGYEASIPGSLQNVHITNSKISNIQPGNWGFGIYVGYESEAFKYSPPKLTAHLDYSGLLIEGNEIENAASSSLVLQSITGTPGTLMVRNNYIHGGENDGIWIDSARNIVIENNVVQNNADGFYISSYGDAFLHEDPWEYDWTQDQLNGPFGPMNISITGNTIVDNITNGGIYLAAGHPGTIYINENSIAGNTPGVANYLSEQVNATSNWWGAVSGPLDDKTLPGTPNYNNLSGTGNRVSAYVDYSPWCTDATCTDFAPPFATTTTITADTPDPSLLNQTVSVTATVAGSLAGAPTPTGTVTISDGVADCTINLVGGTGSCDIAFDTDGAKTITATYNPDTTDFSASSDTESHTVNTSPPSFTSDPILVGNVGQVYTYDVTATDANSSDTLTITAPTKPDWLNFTDNGDGTATLTGTPSAADAGSHAVTLNVSDGKDNVDQSFTINVTLVTTSVTVSSNNSQDGWILESGPHTSKGGTKSSTAYFRVGDDAADKQYRDILSFSTGPKLPDNAVITKVTLRVRKYDVVGAITNPVSTFKGFLLYVKKGYFGKTSLEAADFQASTTGSHMYRFTPALVSGWYNINLPTATVSDHINKASTLSGLTQIRLQFYTADNNNKKANYLRLYGGNSTSRPQLVIEYFVPAP